MLSMKCLKCDCDMIDSSINCDRYISCYNCYIIYLFLKDNSLLRFYMYKNLINRTDGIRMLNDCVLTFEDGYMIFFNNNYPTKELQTKLSAKQFLNSLDRILMLL